MINITIKLSTDENPDHLVVQGHSTKCPGIALTRPISYWYDGKPVFNTNVWVMTHINSGYKVRITKPMYDIRQARAIAARLAESGLDWTKPPEYILENWEQYKDALMEAQYGK